MKIVVMRGCSGSGKSTFAKGIHGNNLICSADDFRMKRGYQRMILSVLPVLYKIKRAGGTPMLAGGFVRDRILGVPSKDIDVEVHGMSQDDLVKILAMHGDLNEVGRSFGVFKLRIGDHEFDFSLPRAESKIGSGHRGFSVETGNTMSFADACMRRDFTFNAMLHDPFSGETIDYFGGEQDLLGGVVKHVNDNTFGDDPLRGLRAFQFAARFDMVVHHDTARIIRDMVESGEMDLLPRERIWTEWEKWALKSRSPSAGLRVLEETSMIDMYPWLKDLVGLEQSPVHHPEGDVFRHTCHAVNAACEISERNGLCDRDRLVLMFSSLCHDFGKAATTRRDDDGDIMAHGHDKAGVGPTAAFLERIGAPPWLTVHVLPLVRNHMCFGNRKNFKAKTCRRLANRLSPSNISMLALLIEADSSARPPLPKEDPSPDLLEWASVLDVCDKAPEPILKGRHLISLGMKPGPEFGKIIRRSFEAQLDGVFGDEQGAIEWAKKEF